MYNAHHVPQVPAGMWHQVECVDDSISINVSLIGATWVLYILYTINISLIGATWVKRACIRVAKLAVAGSGSAFPSRRRNELVASRY